MTSALKMLVLIDPSKSTTSPSQPCGPWSQQSTQAALTAKGTDWQIFRGPDSTTTFYRQTPQQSRHSSHLHDTSAYLKAT